VEKEAMVMPDSNLRPYVSLVIGLFLVGLGLASTFSGEALGRFGRTASRIEEPKKFWSLVAIDYLGGAFGIGYFLFEKYMAR
jgi:MFS family permease